MRTSSGLIFDAITLPHTRKPLTSQPLLTKACQVSGVKRSRYAAIFSSGSEDEAIIASAYPALRQTGVNPKTLRGLAESPISCPRKRGRIDEDRGYKLGVGQTDAKGGWPGLAQSFELTRVPRVQASLGRGR